jgi:imidazolonepropionase
VPSADLVIHNAAQIVTCAFGDKPKRGEEMREVGMLQDGAIAISDKRIVAVGPSPQITRDFSAAELFDAGGRVVCPGFVDPHTHIVYAGNRLDEFELKIRGAEYLDILAAGGGIISTVRHTRSASSEELVAEDAACDRAARPKASYTDRSDVFGRAHRSAGVSAQT